MKKLLLFFCMFLFVAMSAHAQCNAPTSISVNEHWNYVDLSWEADGFETDTSLYYGNVHSSNIGTSDPASWGGVIRFESSDLTGVDGMYLHSVSFLPAEAANFYVKVFTGGSIQDDTLYDSGTMVDSIFISSSDIQIGLLKEIQLSSPLLVSSANELWIGVFVENTGGHPIGVSASTDLSNINRGDLLYLGGWQSMMRDQTNLNFVWYMHANFILSPNNITGFNVLRDNVAINTAPFLGFSYRDTTVLENTNYCYTVESVCGSTSSAYNPPICITTPEEPDCITVGNGTNAQYLLPLNTFYNYSYSQQIFTPTDFANQQGVIESIGYQYIYTSPQTKNNITIYMANVSDSSFSSSSSWIPLSSLTQVFNGTVTFSNTDTYTNIVLDEPFEWDGTSNVVVAFLNGSGSYVSSSNNTFYTHTATNSNSTLYVYTDGSAYNPASPGSGSLSSSRNNMQFCFGPIPTCYRPLQVHTYNVQSGSAEIAWMRHDVENEWEVVVVESGQHISTGVPTTVTDTFYNITNLLDNTDYDVYVRAVCGPGDESEWVMRSFTTTCLPAFTLPITENFDNLSVGSVPNCYIVSGSSTTNPVVSSSYATSGTNSFYFYNTSSNYSYVATQAIDPSINISELMVSLNMRVTSVGNRLDVGVMTDPMDESTFQLIQTVMPTSSSTWTNYQVFLNNYSGTGMYIAFRSDLRAFSMYNYVYIDDVVIDYAPQCSEPVDLEVSAIAGSSAMLTWDFTGVGTPASYNVEISEAGMDTWTTYQTTNMYWLLSGLLPQTQYDVRVSTVCDNNETSIYTTENFLTGCLAGGDITIGTGTTTSGVLPLNGCYNYSYTQQLFTSAELGSSNTLVGLSLNLVTASANNTKNITIYLANTTLNDLTTSSYVPFSDLTQVFSGTVNFVLGQNLITFDTAFNYNGTNLVVAVDDNTGSYSCTPYFASSPSTISSVYNYGDGTNYDPTNYTSTSNSFSYTTPNRNNIIFKGSCDSVANCVAPNLFVLGITSTEASLLWAAGNGETTWELEYKLASDSIWTLESGAITGTTTYTLSNLMPNSSYIVRMRSNCGGEVSDWTSRIIETPCAEIATLPYIQSFDASTTFPDCWYRGTNYTYTNYPTVSTTQSSSSPNSIYFYGSSSYYTYAALPPIDNNLYPLNTLMVSFDAYITYATYYIEVGVMSDPNDQTTFHTIATINPSAINTWENFEVLLNSYTATTGYIAFRTPMGATSYIYIDQVMVDEIPSCTRPIDLVISNLQSDQATFSWTPTDDNYNFELVVDTLGIDPANSTNIFIVTDTFHTVINLTPNTHYQVYVRSLCSDGVNTSTWLMDDFYTLCVALEATDLPHFENFDTYGTGTNAFPNCWGRPVMYSNAPYIYSGSYYTSAPGAIFFTSLTTNPTTLVSPQINVDIETIQVRFQLRAEYFPYSGSIQVGIMSDPLDVSTFELVATVQPTVASVFEEFEVLFDSVTTIGTGKFIAFRHMSNSDYYYYWLDDVVIETIPLCVRPDDISMTGTTSTSATLSWVPQGVATTWNIIYGPTGFNPSTSGTIISTTTNPFTVTGLSADTIYDFYVQSDCGGGELSNLRGPIVVSPGAINMPTSGIDTLYMCGGHLLDDGGINNSYSTSCNGTVIIYPDSPGNVLQIQGTYIGEGCCDYLKIYDGVGISAPLLLNLVGQGSGNTINVGPYTSTTGPLTVQFTSDGSVCYDGFDLSVSCVSASCLPPSGVTGIADLNSVDLSWTENGTATAWNIIYGPAGFDPETAGTTIAVTTNPYTVTGLNAATLYDFYVQADCGSTDGLSNLSSVAHIGTTICASTDQCTYTINMFDQYGDGWNNGYLTLKQNGIEIGSFGNTSFNSSLTGTASLCDGMTTTITWTSGLYDVECSFYITDASGDTVAIFNSLSGLTGIIDSFVVNCSGGAVTCEAPTNVMSSNVGMNGATIVWTAGGTESEWIVEYKEASATTYTVVNNITSVSYQMTGLTANTTYNVRVKAVCDDNSTSSYSSVYTFTTSDCPAPTNLTSVNITSNSAILSWTAGGDETSWVLEYKRSTDADYTSINTSTNPHEIINLLINTTYNVRVKAVCSANNHSSYSSVYTFTTASDGATYTITATAGMGGNITPSGNVTVAHGTNQTFTITPDPSFAVSAVFVDGENLGNITTYTFINVVSDHAIEAQFGTGIEQYNSNENIILYPNPTQNFIEIRVQNNELTINQAAIYDVYGKLIKIEQISNNQATIHVHDFASGIYFIRIETNNGLVTKKFIKE